MDLVFIPGLIANILSIFNQLVIMLGIILLKLHKLLTINKVIE